MNSFQKSQSKKILSCYESLDLIKGKYKKAIQVNRNDGTSYIRVQEVGSNKDVLTKHHGLDNIMNDKELQKKYEDQLKNTIKYKDKFYLLEEAKRNETSGRSSGFYDSKISIAKEINLLPIEVAYRNKIIEGKEKDISEKEIKSLIAEAQYNGDIIETKSLAHNNIIDRNKKDAKEIHKNEKKSNVGKKIREEESKKENEAKEEINKKMNEQNKLSFDNKIKKAQKIFDEIDYDNTTVKQLKRILSLNIGPIPTNGKEILIKVTDSKGIENERKYSDLKKWLYDTSEIPLMGDKKINFKNIKIDFNKNPYE